MIFSNTKFIGEKFENKFSNDRSKKGMVINMKATEKNENATETKSPDCETLFDVFRENRKKNREYFIPLDDAEERFNKVLSFCGRFLKYESGELKVQHVPEGESIYVGLAMPMIHVTKEALEEMRDLMEYLNDFSISQSDGRIHLELYVKYYRREIS